MLHRMTMQSGPHELLESADVARVLRLTPAAVRQLARRGALPVAGVTPRGIRLFTRAAVECLRRERQQHGGQIESMKAVAPDADGA